MCGITGWVDFRDSLQDKVNILRAMNESLTPRGPDEGGEFHDRGCLLGHRRLAVIDIEKGKQPMTFGEYTIVYNGELYNTEEIRSELRKEGYEFMSRSDTEVLLKAYIAWGADCLEKLNGIYAFAVWNSSEPSLFLARDRIGVKPLFYSRYEGGLVFASEIKALFKNPHVRPVLGEEGILSVIMLGPARKGGLGVFEGIEELLPGEYAVLDEKGFRKSIYWSLEAQEHRESLEETAEHLGFLIKDSIERQLVSDVPLCTFLSGGLDSSLISAIAAEKYRSEGRTLSTYSIDYKDNSKNFVASTFQPDEDAPWIEKMQKHIGSQHNRVIIDSPELFEALIPSVKARDLPGMADVDSSLYLFCREVKKDFTVAVSGECADELLGGYGWYHKPELLYAEGFPWSRSVPERRGLLRKNLNLSLSPEEYVFEAARATTDKASCLESDTTETKARRKMFMLNFYWFMQTLLDRKDRCSMAHGLEVRVPFCDHRLAQYAYNIPWEFKAYNGREKGLVRKIAEKYLPYDVVWRKKSPYPKTHNPEYMKLVLNAFDNILRRGTRLTEFLDKASLKELVETEGKSFSGNWYGQLMTAPQLFAYLIQLDAWLREYEPEIKL